MRGKLAVGRIGHGYVGLGYGYVGLGYGYVGIGVGAARGGL